MSILAISKKYLAVARGQVINCYDFVSQNLIQLPSSNPGDNITDIIISHDAKYLAVITSCSKSLLVFELPLLKDYRTYLLPRSASKIRFTADSEQVLVADKSGDVIIYNINKDGDTGYKLLGHFSLLLDVLQTNDKKYIITSDRDEKIKVSCYPNTYNIMTYCLGHKEFVNHLEVLPHNKRFLTSASGDGTVKFWDYTEGTECYSIDVNLDVDDQSLIDKFAKDMDEEKVDVSKLPIVLFDITKLSETHSVLGVAVHMYNHILVYSIEGATVFTHKLEDKLILENSPTALKFKDTYLYVYNDIDCNLSVFEITLKNNMISVEFQKIIKMFEGSSVSWNIQINDSIKILYKRKFDNVYDYQERKKLRLAKSK